MPAGGAPSGDTQAEATPSLTTIAGDVNSSATTFAETIERALPRAMSRSTANGTHARLTTIPHTDLEASNAPKRRDVFHQGHLGDSRAVKESWETRLGGASDGMDLTKRTKEGTHSRIPDLHRQVANVDQAIPLLDSYNPKGVLAETETLI